VTLDTLQRLLLGNNRAAALGPWMGRLHSLVELNLDDNRLLFKFLPHEAGRPPRLEVLCLERKSVCALRLPRELARLTRTGLRVLGLPVDGCPLRPPVE
jgi:hypothetical protein